MPRFFLPEIPLHVIQRGNDRADLFHDDDDYRVFLGCLDLAAHRHGVAIHGYVLMTNHVHLVATPRHAASMPKTMQSVGRVYVGYFNKKYARTGTRLEGRYKAAVIQDETYLLHCMRYVELNPVRAGMVAEPSQYAWSSHGANALAQANHLITPHWLYRALGTTAPERCAAYRELFGVPLPASRTDLLRDATHHGWAAGDESFMSRVTDFSRRAQRLPRGPRRKPVASGAGVAVKL
jgi:putative transposase